MRLTSVDHMRLPTGRVLSLTSRVAGSLGATVPISYDQRRHAGAGDRDGSWMALAFRLDLDASLGDLAAAWRGVIARHGTLRTVMTVDDGLLALREAEVVVGAWQEHRPDDAAEPSRSVLRRVLDATCRPFAAPSHRLCVVLPDDPADPRPVLVVAADHCHLDMWSLLVLLRDLRACLLDVAAGRAPGAALEPASSFALHTRVLAERGPAPSAVTDRWSAVLDAGGGVLPRCPLPLGDVSEPRPQVVEVRDLLDADQLAALTHRADRDEVRITALALGVVAATARELSGRTLRAVFPVHSRDEPRWADAVGWFITNSVIDVPDTSPVGCRAALTEALALGSHPLAPILGHLDAELSPPGMLALSWLDVRRLPGVPAGLDVQYVSAALRTDGVMVWFLVQDDGLHLRCRYPDTPEARDSMSRWLDAIGHGLRRLVTTDA